VDFQYNEETRIHTLNGKVIPSVSQVIAPLSDFSKIPASILARKTELGKQFHEAAMLFMLNDLDYDSLDPDLIKPMRAFGDFWRYKNFPMDHIDIEVPLCHKTLKYCGKPDIVMPMDLIDWKLRPYNPVTDPLQLAGYKHMLPAGRRGLWTVCFDLEGNYRMHDSRHPKAWGIFRRMLEHCNQELEFNNLMESWKGLAK
jgi:hypothetical protein